MKEVKPEAKKDFNFPKWVNSITGIYTDKELYDLCNWCDIVWVLQFLSQREDKEMQQRALPHIKELIRLWYTFPKQEEKNYFTI